MKDNVMIQAEQALEYWDSETLWGRLIERDLENNDLEALQFHVNEANSQKQMQESFDSEFMRRLLEGEPLIQLDNLPDVDMPEGFKAGR